jgi:hypothetical protein
VNRDEWMALSKAERRERTRASRVERHKLDHPQIPPRAYRREQANLGKKGRKGKKAAAKMARILERYGVGTR